MRRLLHSPYVHGEILSIDTGAAKASPGVLGVFTGQDIADDLPATPEKIWRAMRDAGG
jgi:CO/xanthine dehydrogenase Mo-binding subunit